MVKIKSNYPLHRFYLYIITYGSSCNRFVSIMSIVHLLLTFLIYFPLYISTCEIVNHPERNKQI